MYTGRSMHRICVHFQKNVQVRRIKLSIQYKLSELSELDDLMILLFIILVKGVIVA